MAEKEERKGELRIQINQFLWPTCKECGSKCKDEKEIKFCRDSQPGIIRSEAIEKIARAICRSGGNECIGDCESCDLWQVGPEKDYAEAALNALLEDK